MRSFFLLFCAPWYASSVGLVWMNAHHGVVTVVKRHNRTGHVCTLGATHSTRPEVCWGVRTRAFTVTSLWCHWIPKMFNFLIIHIFLCGVGKLLVHHFANHPDSGGLRNFPVVLAWRGRLVATAPLIGRRVTCGRALHFVPSVAPIH